MGPIIFCGSTAWRARCVCTTPKAYHTRYQQHRFRLATCFGADIVLNPGEKDIAARVLSLTGDVGCDIYIEATGHSAAVQQGLNMIRKGGTFVEFSVMSGPPPSTGASSAAQRSFTIKDAQLSPGCYETAINDLMQGCLPTEGIVTHSFRLEDWAQAYRTAQAPEAL